MRRWPALVPLLLGACHVGPHYAAPVTPSAAAPRFIESANNQAVSPTRTDPRWWRLYHDPVLEALITDAFAANTDLRIAYANVARTRGYLREARADRFPTTTTTGSITRSQSSVAFGSGSTTGGATGGGAGTGTGGTGSTDSSNQATSIFDLAFAVSYELDLFGRVYREIEAARRDVETERALAEQMRVTVAADTANAYVNYCSSVVQEAVAIRTVALQDSTLRITQTALDFGSGTRLDVERARALREQSAATIQTFRATEAAARYNLAALTGRAPADLRPEALNCKHVPVLAQPIPIGDGAALIARRPDVRAAERSLAADTARIGLATASLYPTISLGGSAGLVSGSARQLFSGSAFQYSIGPLLSFTFPNQEAARGRILAAQGQGAVSLATFDRAVLTALQDTETALSALARELDRRQALTRARDAAQKAAILSRLRLTEGIDNFLTELDADRTLATAEAQLAQSDQLVAQDQVALFRALGGGWENNDDPRGDVKPVFDGSRRG